MVGVCVCTSVLQQKAQNNENVCPWSSQEQTEVGRTPAKSSDMM